MIKKNFIRTVMTQVADIAVIGLAVMGQNLILNIADHGFTVVAFNRTTSKTHEFVNGPGKHPRILPSETLPELIKLLKRPRKIVLMVKAGQAIDDFIIQLLPLLQPGDILVDGGNSHYLDTTRRCKELEAKDIYFVGCGISGGEEGARYGPSIMPGGSHEAFGKLAPILTSIAARAPKLDVPCCAWVGEAGAGHFVKMVHNGIEYGDMQLIAESYHLLKSLVNLSGTELAQVFSEWNEGELNSFLIEITANILKVEKNGEFLVEKIRDVAGQKGTGKWTVNASLDLGIPTTLITEAVFARGLSALKEERVQASKLFPSPVVNASHDKKSTIEDIKSVTSVIYAYVGIVCFKDYQLRTRLYDDEGGSTGIQLQLELSINCHALDGRVHHPLRLPLQHPSSLYP